MTVVAGSISIPRRILAKPWFLTVLSGLLLALCFPGADWGWLAFVALAPLLIAISDVRPSVAYGRGFVVGCLFFAILYSWIANLAESKIGPIGGVAGYLLAIVMAQFIAIFAACASVVLRSPRIPELMKLVAIPSIWVLVEFVRQLGSLGMGWGDLGYTQWRDPVFLRIAPLTGIWGLSWLIVLVNTAIVLRKPAYLAGSILLIAAAILLNPLATRNVHPSGQPYIAAALQANINQDVLWDRFRPADSAYYDYTLKTFDDMTREAHAKGAKLCLLSETATPGYIRFDSGLRGWIENTADSNDMVFVAGGRDTDLVTAKDRNVAFLIAPGIPQSGPFQTYAKQELVPFGEYVPFAEHLKWLTVLQVANFNDEPGDDDQLPLNAGPQLGKVGVNICYESSYSRFMRQQTLAGANVLTVITDDTWFGRSAAARQHMAMSAIRAAECDRYLVRCAATGISAIFSSDGRELAEAGIFQKAVVTATVVPSVGETFFIRFGDWFVWVCGGIVVVTVLWALIAGRLKSRQQSG